MKSMRALLPIGLCAGLGAAYLYLSPYVTVYFLSRAIRSNDAQSIARYIELPSVRDSIRTQIQEYIEYSSKADGYDAAWTALAKGFGGAISEEIVVRATSPEGIERILRTGQFGLDQVSSEESVPPSQDLSSASIKYLSFDRVVVSFPPESEQSLRSIDLTRRNLVDWKITSAEFDFTSPRSKGGVSSQHIACGKSIARVEGDIAITSGIPIASFRKEAIESPYQGRQSGFIFVLGRSPVSYNDPMKERVDTFLENSDMTLKLFGFSRQIIADCADVATVSFAPYATGYRLTWYYSPDAVFKGECITEFPRPALRWGQHICT